MTRYEFHVEGDPVPQGSTKSFIVRGKGGAPVLRDGQPMTLTTNDESGRLGRWRGDVRTAAKAVRPPADGCLEGPVAVAVDFWIRRPKKHYWPLTRTRTELVLRDDAPTWHTADPDGDKLLRGVLDALTAVLYRDDNQVVIAHVTKRWARDGGATITVSEVVE